MARLRQMLVLSSAVLLACNKPEITHEGVHIRLAALADTELCAGTIAHMDRFVELLSAEFRITAPTGRERIDFFWVGREDLHALSSCQAPGCAFGRTIFSLAAPHDHELVHAVVSPLAHPAPFFTEGLAQAYEGLNSDDSKSASEWRPGHVRDGLDATTSSGVNYAAAGAFVAHLIAAHGIHKFLRAYTRIPRRADLDDIDTVFRDVFGVTVQDSIADYEVEGRRCGPRGYTARLAECEAPKLEWDGIRLIHWRDLACDQSDAVGPYDGAIVQVFHTVVIPEAGEYRIAFISDDPATSHRLSLDACTHCIGPELTLNTGERAVVTLSPGRHALRIRGPVHAPTRAGILIERFEPEDAS